MHAQQVERRRLGDVVGQQFNQPPRAQVGQHVVARLVGDAVASQRPAAHQVAIVADAVALDGNGGTGAVAFERPAVVQGFAQHERQAIVAAQVGRCLRHAMARQIRG
jgi:hypothetical protein